jgi:hypothetical protein
MSDMVAYIGDVTIAAEDVVEAAVTVVDVVGLTLKSNDKHVGNCGRKRKDDGELASNKLKKATHGTANFLKCQEACKAEATATSIMARDHNISYWAAAKSMQRALMEHVVSLAASTCREHVMKALANGCQPH